MDQGEPWWLAELSSLDEIPLPDIVHLPQLDKDGHIDFSDVNADIVAVDLGVQSHMFEHSDRLSDIHNLSSGRLTSIHRDTPDSTKLLSRLCTTETLFKQSANLIIEALCAIPEQILRKQTFPSFIHPHWDGDLPEPIVVCMHIAQIFASRTPEIEPFIWRTILAEQQRLTRKACIFIPTSTRPQLTVRWESF